MSQDRKRTRTEIEGDKEDRISDLLRNVIDSILELLPTRDAARTSILSKKWRFFWCTLPYIVLDRQFFDDLPKKSRSFVIPTIYGILLLHVGDIVKFHLYLPEDLFLGMPFQVAQANIEKWILKVTRHGLKELILKSEDDRYSELPSCLFCCKTLTRMELNNFSFKPPNSFLEFPKLESLHLHDIKFDPTAEFCVLNVPRLVKLKLLACSGTEYFKIVAPLLEKLVVRDIDCLVLNCFMTCKKLRVLKVEELDCVDAERLILEKLIFSLASTLEVLYWDLFPTELSSVGRCFMFNCLWCLYVHVDFGGLSSASGALQIINSAPNLTQLVISVDSGSSVNPEAVLKYLNTPTCLDRQLNKLKHVVIGRYLGSEVELLFMKLLLARSPSLLRVKILQQHFCSSQKRIITAGLMTFPIASSKVAVYLIDVEGKLRRIWKGNNI